MGGRIPASNLTTGNGGIATGYRETDWIRAIRHGVKQNGQGEIFMYDYSAMSDKDLGDLIAYLKQLSPVDAKYPAIRYGPVFPVAVACGLFTPVAGSINHDVQHVPHPEPAINKAYGEYLFTGCRGCHSTGVTPKLQAKWSLDDFVKIMRQGVLPNGKTITKSMPVTTYGEMNDTELAALWNYLRSQ